MLRVPGTGAGLYSGAHLGAFVEGIGEAQGADMTFFGEMFDMGKSWKIRWNIQTWQEKSKHDLEKSDLSRADVRKSWENHGKIHCPNFCPEPSLMPSSQEVELDLATLEQVEMPGEKHGKRIMMGKP